MACRRCWSVTSATAPALRLRALCVAVLCTLAAPTNGLLGMGRHQKSNGPAPAGKILCMAWASGAPQETPLLPLLRCQFDLVCDKGLIYTDTESPVRDKADFAVKIPTQHFEGQKFAAYPDPDAVEMPRNTSNWLYHKNFVGFIPAWDHLFKSGIAGDYDWVINVEADMALFRNGLDTVLAPFTSSRTQAATVVALGNAFAFNKMARRQMSEYWAKGVPTHPNGCPKFFKLNSNPDHAVFTSCSQDQIYPSMFAPGGPVPGVAMDGKPQCGWKDTADRCMELHPLRELSRFVASKTKCPECLAGDDGVFALIKQAKEARDENAFLDSIKDKSEQFSNLAKKVYWGRNAAIWHHVVNVKAFKTLFENFGSDFPPTMSALGC